MQECCATIGMFDGLHRGHRYLLEQVVQKAHELGLQSAVFTFKEHPANVLGVRDGGVRLLMSQQEKVQRLGELVDEVYTLDFTAQLARLKAREFMQMIRKCYSVKALVMGFDHHFGNDFRSLTFEDYRRIGSQVGIDIYLASEREGAGGRVHLSSTSARMAITLGDMPLATDILGSAYSFSGIVVKGYQNGRKLGFPTANLSPLEPLQLLPMRGVYCVKAYLGEDCYTGVCNIGIRPSVTQDGEQSIEVYMKGFTGDIYGKVLRVEFYKRIRGEKKFDSLSELSQQIASDVRHSDDYFSDKI